MSEFKLLTQVLIKLELDSANPSIIADIKYLIETVLAKEK